MLLNTPICDFGWQAPSFSLNDPDGNNYSLEGLMGERGLVIVFMCNHCPYVKAIIDRLVQDAETLHRSQVNMVAIMPNDFHAYPEDAPDKMTEFAARHQMHFPYLIDADQQIAASYGAVCTPDFFGLNGSGQLQYRGRLDNLKMNAEGTRVQELVDAMQLIARTGTGPESQTPSMGCSIKWKTT